MHNILCLNKISPLGTDRLGENYTYAAEIENPEGILVRSAAMHDMELPNSLLAIARAGAGVNNIPVEKCAEAGIVVFNTPGANANAVKELVLAALLLTSRKIVPAIEWAQTLKGTADISKQVEKGKSAFAGPEILGKKLGVIGLGDRRARCERRTDARHAGIRLRPVPFRGRCMEPFERHCEGRFRG